ncbi:phage holin family protein [Fodinibius sediminis]|uniref:Holin-X, holin superfamily III n=1 Tax=Fodinibius sediminis TaxID=1214077 RepID=A0A521DBG5_9BACT|nr:phage holin family protein [Fodinibius sediminis]SMO68441.1 Putative Holin-X, holin superfamily III [Fodinibius sediminis]
MKTKKSTDQVGQKLRGITTDLKRYVEKRIELMMLNFGEHFSKWMAISVQRSAGALLLLVGTCFLLVALAVYLENLLAVPGLGFALVSIPLFIFGGLFVYLKPRRLFRQLQELFEEEVIEAIEQNNKEDDKQKQLEASEHRKSYNNEE